MRAAGTAFALRATTMVNNDRGDVFHCRSTCRAWRSRTSLRRNVVHPSARVSGSMVRITRASELHAVADIDYLDSTGQLLGRLEGYECAIDPALDRAFRRRALVGG